MYAVDRIVADSLSAEIAGRSEELALTLSTLIRQTSVSGAEERASTWLYDFLVGRGWIVERQRLAESAVALAGGLGADERIAERENLLAWPVAPTPGLPVVVVNGHMDVVTAGDEDAWTHPPFSGARVGGRILGRGAVDTKGGIVSAIIALESLRRALDDLPFAVALELVVGEETTGSGTRAIADLVPRPAAAIVLEATGGALVPVSTGLLFFTVRVKGVSAHTSAPWRGRDAFVHLMSIHRALAEFASERGAAFRPPLFATVPTAVPFAVGVARAGTWRAAVPDTAEMSGRFGVAPGEDLTALKRQIEGIIGGLDELESWPSVTAIEWQHDLPGWETDESDPLVLSFVAAISEVTGSQQMLGLTAASDASYFAAMHVPTVIYGPGDLSLAHGPDEWVSVDSLVEAATVIAFSLLKLAGDDHAE